MKQYEDKKFEMWREHVESHLLSYLKRNLLTRAECISATTRSVKDDSTAENDIKSPVNSKCDNCRVWKAFTLNSTLQN